MSAYYVYIVTNKPRGTLYTGVTNDLVRRMHEHREGLADGFSKRYGLRQLVHYERHDTPGPALQREKNIKHWSRGWKLDLVNSTNPKWDDFFSVIVR